MDRCAVAIAPLLRTFYDFDYGISQVRGAQPAIEIMQMGPQATSLEMPYSTEIIAHDRWSEFLSGESLAVATSALPSSSNWRTAMYQGTVYGVGDDNPSNPYSLTQLQRRRSVIVMFEYLSSYQIRCKPAQS